MIQLFFCLPFLSCQGSVSKSDTSDSAPADSAVVDPDEEEEGGTSFVLLEQDVSGAIQLSLRNTADWSVAESLREASLESKIVRKDGFIWLLNRGSQEGIVQYDPMDFSQSVSEHILQTDEPVYPSDVSICENRVFVTLYQGREMLVLDSSDLHEVGRIPLDAYADDDGLAEASSVLCKKGFLYVSLHRLNQEEIEGGESPQQLGSIWIKLDPVSLQEVAQFPDQGFKSDLYDVRNTQYLGSVIRPHIDVSGTTGFWIYDPVEDWFFSQIYFAYNDKTIFDTAIGSSKVVHLATNYSDGATWLFCHDFTPGADLPGYSYEELVPVQHEFVSITMNDEDEAWMSLQKRGDSPRFSFMSIDTDSCMANSQEYSSSGLILDWEILE